jgi:hypothetical protein
LSDPPPGRARRYRGGWLLLAVLALGIVVARVVIDSRAALRAGVAAEAAGDRARASREYLHAVRMYVPGSPSVRRAVERLEALAQTAAQAGNLEDERRAREALRSGLLGARSVYTPYADRLAASDRRLAEIYARLEDPAVAPGATPEQRRAWHLERLAARPGPRLPATFAALFGFALWLSAAILFIRKGIDRGLRLQPRWGIATLVAFGVGFALFVLGLRLA